MENDLDNIYFYLFNMIKKMTINFVYGWCDIMDTLGPFVEVFNTPIIITIMIIIITLITGHIIITNMLYYPQPSAL